MKSSFKKLPGSMIELEVSLEQKEFLLYYQSVYDNALAQVEIKGFRRGAAPKELAEQAMDKEKVFNEAVNHAVRWSLDEVTKENNWTLIDAPKVEVQDSKGLGLYYKATLTTFPEIKLGNYKKIAKNVLAERKPVAIETKEVDQTLEWVRNSRKQGEQVPELTDEFAKSLGKFQNIAELKKSIEDGLKMEKEMKETDRLRIKILDEIVKDSKMEIPEIMVSKTYESMEKRFGPMLKAGGKSEEEIKKQLQEKARSNVANHLVMYQIAKTEQLEPKPEEIADDENYNYNYDITQQQKVFNFLESQK